MAIVNIITANCENNQLSQQMVSRQWDDKGTLIQFAGYPEPEGDEALIFRLIVWMKESEDAEPRELPPILLDSDQWLISNYYTQLVQTIKFQLCITNETGTYEKHSPVFAGHIGRSLSHNGQEGDIDVIPLFDPYMNYVDEKVNDLIVAAGDVQIDASLSTSGAAADAKATGDAIAGVNGRLDQISGKTYEVKNASTGGVNVAYPMSVGESIFVTNNTPASIEVRQRNGTTVIATTVMLSGDTKKITSTVDSTDIRFYFNQGGTILFEDADTRLTTLEEKVTEVDTQKEIQSFLIGQLVDSKLIYHATDYHSDQLNSEVVVAEFDVGGLYNTVYIKGESFSNVTNGYPVGIKEYNANNEQIGITGRSQAGILNGTQIRLTSANTVKVKVYINVGANSKNSIKNLFVWRTRNGRINNKPYPVFRVEKDGSGDFTSLVSAINEATMYMDAKVYVGAGTWDIIEELGESYLANVSDSQRGVYLKNRVHLICDSRSKIVANYTGTLSNVKTWLAIFNSGPYGFTLENATLEGSNIRYLIHDERDQDTDAYINKYINCTMVFDNRNNDAWSAKQCIGGGLGQNGYIDIEGCTFKSYQGYDGTVSYHNTGASSGRSHIVVRDCFFYLYNTFRLSWYGTSTEITDAVVTNCYLGAEIVHRAESASATVENTAIVSWNNTVNPH